MLTLICGLPNAGKTTYSANFQNVIHADDVIGGKGKIKDFVKDMVDDICIEGIFISAYERGKLVEWYDGDGCTCIWIDTPYEVCCQREDRNRSTVLIENCKTLWQDPSYDEGWDEIIRIPYNG